MPPGAGPRPGDPRSERDAAFVERFNAWMRLPIIVSAVLPLIVTPGPDNWFTITIGVASWLVFLVDYVVHARHLVRYRRTGLGRFDLFVVIATAPWFLLPSAHAGGFVVLLRLARLARVVLATRGARRLFERLGRVAAVAFGVVFAGSLVAYYAEHSVNPEFATFGDALWWGIVTLTTVGYGDIVPETTTGRWAAVTIMVTGIAVLGVLAGSLASFFRLDQSEANNHPPPAQPPAAQPPAAQPSGPVAGDTASGDTPSGDAASGDTAIAALAAEVAALRRQVEVLTERLTRTPADTAPAGPAPGEDTAG